MVNRISHAKSELADMVAVLARAIADADEYLNDNRVSVLRATLAQVRGNAIEAMDIMTRIDAMREMANG